MKKLIFTILIILLCLTSFMLVSCDEEEDTTTVKPPEFSITYELNGGTNSVDNPLTYKKGDVVTLNNPTKDNYYFKGWYTDA
ncbi:MAG: InlB B-repeat-containing protein, partial [Clostridia bacterium]|nr:InlB B-repeat-containing protein [Clostridia bacterium]